MAPTTETAPGTAQEPENKTQTQETQGQQGNGEEPIRLAENPYNFLQEILKTPLGDGRYEIAKEAPKRAFKGRGSPKTLAQTAKKQLVQSGVIKIISRGGSNKRAIVELLNDNVVMSNEGRGRKVGAARVRKAAGRKKAGKVVMQTRKASTRKGGRKKAAGGAAVKRNGNGATRTTPTAHRGGRKPTYVAILDRLFQTEEDPQAFKTEMGNLAKKYPNSFNKFMQAVKA